MTHKKHGRGAVRRKIRGDYRRKENYRAVADLWGLSEGTVWRLINRKSYWPTGNTKTQLEKAARVRGIVVGVRPLPKE